VIRFVDIESIHIGERQRRIVSEEKLNELKESIKADGLMYPLIVRVEQGRFVLIAGWRRMQAIKRLQAEGVQVVMNGIPVPDGKVPVFIVHVGKDTADVLEFAENEFREQLDWRDRARVIAELHKRKVEETAGQQRIADTAKLVGLSDKVVSEDLLIAQYLDREEVKGARKRVEALKAAKRLQDAETRIEVAERKRQERSGEEGADAKLEQSHVCYIGDAFELLGKLQGEFAAVVADPPYGVDIHTVSNTAAIATRPDYDDSPDYGIMCYELLAERIPELMPSGYAFIFLSSSMWCKVFEIFKKTGKFDLWQSPLIWHKQSGWVPSSKGFKKTYDMILVARVNPKPLLRHISDVISIPTEKSVRANKKPKQLYVELLKGVVTKNEAVLDPFCGMGTIFEAANELGLHAEGIERDETIVAAGAAKIPNVKIVKDGR